MNIGEKVENSLKSLSNKRKIPRPMTKKELDARRRLLLKQAEEIQKKYPTPKKTP